MGPKKHNIDITPENHAAWLKNPYVNPTTGKRITAGGKVYKAYEKYQQNPSSAESEYNTIITPEHHAAWLKNPNVNPTTGRSITSGGKVYKAYAQYHQAGSSSRHLTPQPHQVKSLNKVARDVLTGKKLVWLADKGGSGKTLTTILALEKLFQKTPLRNVVICVGKNLLTQWQQDLTSFKHLAIVSGGPVERRKNNTKKRFLCLPNQINSILSELKDTLLVVDEFETLNQVAWEVITISSTPSQLVLVAGSEKRPKTVTIQLKYKQPRRREKKDEWVTTVFSDFIRTGEWSIIHNTAKLDYGCPVEHFNYYFSPSLYMMLVDNAMDKTLLHNDLSEATEYVREELLKKGIVPDKFADIIVMKRLFDMDLIKTMKRRAKNKTNDVLRERIATLERKWVNLDAAWETFKDEYEDCAICYSPMDTPYIYPCCQYVICAGCVERLDACPMRCENSSPHSLEKLAVRYEYVKDESVESIVKRILKTFNVAKSKCLIVTNGEFKDNDFETLNGSAVENQKMVDRYCRGNLNTLVVPSVAELSGLRLTETTDIIAIHTACDGANLDKVIASGLRIDRERLAELRLHRIEFV